MTAEPAFTSEGEWGRWLDSADPATRKANPQYYWFVKPDQEPTQFFWDERSVSREEYVASTGDDVRAGNVSAEGRGNDDGL